ncbi:MAG: quinoprotein relay system zinc metallohydrolase 1 [Zoogloeaceae bacterium]|nr:quinoprotein relay system zinc metallohydrolase 1 [Zoogloeaceae bacterium]
MKTRLAIVTHLLFWTLILILGLPSAWSAEFDYQLQPKAVAPDTWVLQGRLEDFSFANGGNIVNTAFITTADGVVVIDSGPSLRYGQQLLAAIRKVSAAPIARVLITHHHPDHFLGNQAFPPASIAALPGTIQDINREGKAFAENMYRLTGDWMAGTEAMTPAAPLAPGTLEIGGHRLELLALAGHTGTDLGVFDRTTGVLFGGDLVFYQRAPTTPHARIPAWLTSLNHLAALPFQVLVPGHGPVTRDGAPLRQTRDYLLWLDQTMRDGAAAGLDMTEMLARPLPPAFRDLAVQPEEYRRSVAHLFPAAEQAVLEPAGARR